MKKESLLWIVIVLLLLLNGTTLFFAFGPRRGEGGPGGRRTPASIIRETLQLTDQQEAQYRQMRDSHHARMERLRNQYEQLLVPYFALLERPYQKQERDSLEGVLAVVQGLRASVTFDHFAQLKSICTPEQQAKFSVLMPQITEVIRGGRQERPGGEGGR